MKHFLILFLILGIFVILQNTAYATYDDPESLVEKYAQIAEENTDAEDKMKELEAELANEIQKQNPDQKTIEMLQDAISEQEQILLETTKELSEIQKLLTQKIQIDPDLKKKLETARDILHESQDIIPWTGLGVSNTDQAVSISIDAENPEEYRSVIEKLVGKDIPVVIKKGGDPFISTPLPPLKQLKSGVSIDDMQCKDDMVLLKKHSGSPACVKPDSVIDLIKRNWMVTEEIGGYAIDYDGDVKHLPFADICTNEMKIILLTHSNIASPDEEFVMEDMMLPSRMNQEDFENCARETDFTKSRWNMMVSMTNPEPAPFSLDEKNLSDARNKLREVYHADASFGPFTIKDAIVGYGIDDGFLVVDILEDYYNSDENYQLITQKIIDITGGKVDIEFNSSSAIVPTNIESIFPHIWNGFLHRNGIEFTPKDHSYANNDIGYGDVHRVCSPVVTSNGTELYISSVFVYEPFEITGTFIDKIKPDDCYKVWKTDTVLEEPDRILMLWLENYHKGN